MMQEFSEIECINGYYFKREDKFIIGDACGGKARAAYGIITDAIKKGNHSFTTTGSRDSRQCDVVSSICESLKVECNIFMPNGKDPDVSKSIEQRLHSRIYRTKVGYNNVLVSESRKFAQQHNSFYIPFGLECEESIKYTAFQVQNIPMHIKRIIIPCGGGMNMIGVVKGLKIYGRTDIKVIGVQVGKDPKKTIDKFLGDNTNLFDEHYNLEIIKSDLPYSKPSKECNFCGIELDPIYESKCIPFIEKGDLFWIVGKRL